MTKLLLSTLLISLFTLSTLATEFNSYYPQEFSKFVSSKDVDQDELKEYLFLVLQSSHQRVKNGQDKLGCDTNSKGDCYAHVVLGYSGARKVLFGKLHLEQDADGYFIKDVYCHKEIRSRNTRMGPGTIPNNNIINCEHTWPQSKFTGKFDKEMQKSDLHHLYPTDTNANSVRGNYPFDDLATSGAPVDEDDCNASKSIHGKSFEPPTEHKGNVARALFYFSVRYHIQISGDQEATLKRWHQEDPVDEAEMKRNNEIYSVQKNRNPFIDFPELVSSISNF